MPEPKQPREPIPPHDKRGERARAPRRRGNVQAPVHGEIEIDDAAVTGRWNAPSVTAPA